MGKPSLPQWQRQCLSSAHGSFVPATREEEQPGGNRAGAGEEGGAGSQAESLHTGPGENREDFRDGGGLLSTGCPTSSSVLGAAVPL